MARKRRKKRSRVDRVGVKKRVERRDGGKRRGIRSRVDGVGVGEAVGGPAVVQPNSLHGVGVDHLCRGWGCGSGYE